MVAVPTRVQNQLKSLPAKPGVYLFRDADGDVLYVGKAKIAAVARPLVLPEDDGRARADPQPAGARRGRRGIVTGSEVEALHLEQNLVKRTGRRSTSGCATTSRSRTSRSRSRTSTRG
jgi:Nuclease subunit of the excinuclease complex